jgi:hypothetical protein
MHKCLEVLTFVAKCKVGKKEDGKGKGEELKLTHP